MILRKNFCIVMFLLVLISICLTSCGQAVEINVGCDVDDLIDAINSANANTDTTRLILDTNCTYSFTSKDNSDGGQGPNGLPIVTTKIVIEGNNAILLRSTPIAFRFFFITGSGNLRLEDITMENGYGLVISADQSNTRGGAIYNDGGALRAERSIFRENQAILGEGGAIYNLGILTLEDTLFEINSSNNGGAIYNNGIMNIAAVLQEVNFDTNIAHANGGAIYNASAEQGFLISGSTFDSNHSTEHGGAIFMEAGDLDISHSEFLENKAGRGVGPHPDWGDGGAIYSLAGDVTLIATNFNIHTALGVGGILYAGPGSNVRLRDVTSETSRACHGGGALYVEGETEILETTIMKGNAGGYGSDWGWDYLDAHHQECEDTDGGAIYNAGTLAIDRSLLLKNQAMGDGDGVYNLGDLTVLNSTFHYGCCGGEDAINNHGSAELSLSTLVYSGLANSATMTVKNIVVATHTNGCINSGTLVDMDQNIALDPACPFSTILADRFQLKIDMISLSDNGGPTLTNRVKWDSPVIGNATCSTVSGDPVTEDQRGESRPFPGTSTYNCDIGAYEVHDFTHEPQPPPLPPTPPLDSGPEPSLPCDSFEELQYSLNLSNIPHGTTNLTLNIKITSGDPGSDDLGPDIWDALEEMAYSASLGDTGAEGYQEEGYPNRIYFHFTLPESAPGNVRDFSLFRDGCDDPLVSIPRVTIPEQDIPDPDKPSLTCKIGLDKESCKKAGGTYNTHGGVSQPTCDCP